ncbi:Alpha/Beta hydrolase protein [Aspergillus venezuelensis]
MGCILGDKIEAVAPHKGSIKGLWEMKWKFAIEDFEPIFQSLIAKNINDAYSDEYTKAFLPTAESLEQRASDARKQADTAKASELYRRAAVVYRISRFPYVGPETAGITREAFERQKRAYLKATSFWKPVLQEQIIPHTHRAGNDGGHVPIYVRVPDHATAQKPVPALVIVTGLDGYRPDNSARTHEIIQRGWGVVIAEIPGTGDSPADPVDPGPSDRLLDSVLRYMEGEGKFDMGRVVVWGLSAGGFYADRAAHMHSARLAGCIAHGPGVHHFLDREWLDRVEDHEYPFPILRAWAEKYGYDEPRDFYEKAQGKFSHLETGIVDQPSCRLLLLNGVDDGIVPIEDCLLLFNHGLPKEGR